MSEQQSTSPVGFDETQRAALEAAAGGSVAIVGAPGSGKTTTLVEVVAESVDAGVAPEQILAIAANRRLADDLRERIASRLGIAARGATLGRTAASIAMEIVGIDRAKAGLGRPRLLTGSEQDAILADLIEGRLEDLDSETPRRSPLPWPEWFDPATMRLRGFRDELRQLLASMAELGVDAEELARLGADTADPDAERSRTLWPAVAHLARDYEDVLVFGFEGAFDTPGVLGEAARIVDAARERFSFAGSLAEVRLVVVDDAQELTEPARRLLVAFERAGARIVTFGDPDLGTGDFHGGRAEFATNWRDAGESVPERVILGKVHRHGEELRRHVVAVAERVGVRGETQHRRAVAGPRDRTDGLPVIAEARCDSEVAEHDLAVGYLRRLHLTAGVPFEQMAVIARSASRLPALAATFDRAGVATSSSTPVSAVADATVRAILDLGAAAVDGEVDSGVLRSVLTSPLYGIDPIEYRRLRRAAVVAEMRARQGSEEAAPGDAGLAVTRTGAAVLADTVNAALRSETDPVGGEVVARLAAGPRPAAARAVLQLVDVLRRMRERVEERAPLDVVLFEAWRDPRRADEWQRIALSDGPAAPAMHRRLDALVVLFDRAKRAVERSPGITLAGFLTEWQRDAVVDDSLAKRARVDAVTLTTPAGAVGREWRAVVLVGMNEGMWPNLRVRDTLLGADRLRELCDGLGADGGLSALDRRAEVLSSETRLLVSAMSRARDHLLITAQERAETQPSPFLRWLAAPPLDEAFAIGDAIELANGHITLGGLAAELRRELAVDALPPERARHALRALARLGAEGITAAQPESWAGVQGPSTSAPLVRIDDAGRIPIRIRPSGLQRFDECGVNWFVEAIAGAPPSAGQAFGTLLHLVAEHEGRFADVEEMQAFAQREFEKFEFASALERATTHRRLVTAVDSLWTYVRRGGVDGHLDEQAFELSIDEGIGELGDVPLTVALTVAGRIDRLETMHHVVDGKDAVGMRIVDFKSGDTVPKTRDDHRNAQLTTYQLALRDGAIQGVDASTPIESSALVFPEKPSGRGGKRRPYTEHREIALTDAELGEERHRLVATGLAQHGVDWTGEPGDLRMAPVFHAEPDIHCEPSYGAWRNACALHMIPEVTA